MGRNKENLLAQNFNLEKEIKEHLKNCLSLDAYNTWIDNFYFECIDKKNIRVIYYGNEPLSVFKKEYKKEVHMQINSLVGERKKFKIKRKKVKKEKTQSQGMKKNLKTAKLLIFSLIFVLIALAIAVVTFSYIDNRTFRETFYNVSSLKADNGIRVVQISDLHTCFYGKDNEKLLSRVRLLEPDVIICTGDIVDTVKGNEDGIEKFCRTLSDIAPSYFIYGNNEVERIYGFVLNKEELDKRFGSAEKLSEFKDEFEESLEKTGIKVLKNEKDTITLGTTKVDIYGVLTSNPSSFEYAEESFNEYLYKDESNIKITAIHEPVIIEEFDSTYWGDMTLCGHTHGGYVRIPVLGPLYTYEGGVLPERGGSYVYGRYNVNGTAVIVSAGLENRSIFRINNEPELVIIDINKF